jgi:soluble lytic murein transglycosylase-like protein
MTPPRRVGRAVLRRWRSQSCGPNRLRRLGLATALGLLMAAPAVSALALPSGGAEAIDRFAAFVAQAAQRFGVPAAWIRAVMRIESGGEARALSPKGAMGLMQLMPQTWADLRLRYGLGADPFDPHDNIIAGAAYLRELHDRFGAPGFLAAYNVGPARYEDYLAAGRPLPAETGAYVAAFARSLIGGADDEALLGRAPPRPWADAPLFAGRATNGPARSPAQGDPPTIPPMAVGSAAMAPGAAGLFVTTSARSSRP